MITAEILGVDNQLGSLEADKLADIIKVVDDPLENIGTMEKVVFVKKEGKIYKDAK
ncbi:MAG: hypothetical protein ACFB15_06100 [Cyclobacteriaceae bacterium]